MVISLQTCMISHWIGPQEGQVLMGRVTDAVSVSPPRGSLSEHSPQILQLNVISSDIDGSPL